MFRHDFRRDFVMNPAFFRRFGRRPLKSLKGRLALWIFLPALLISGSDLLFTYFSADHSATLVQGQLLKGSAKIISEQIVSVDDGYEVNVPPAAFELFASEYHDHVYYNVHTLSGQLIAGGDEIPPFKGVPYPEQSTYFPAKIRDEPVWVVAYVHALPNASTMDMVVTQVAQTRYGHAAFRKKIFFDVMRGQLILLFIVLAGLMIAFRWTLHPLIAFGKKLRQREPGSLEKMDTADMPLELMPVIHAMNDYVARLDKTLSSYEHFVASTAHQLRTSFAIMTSQLNFAQRSVQSEAAQKELQKEPQALNNALKETLDAMQKTVIQGTKVINQLLVLAALDRDRQEQVAPRECWLAELVQGVMEELAPMAQQKDIEFGIDVFDESVLVCAQPYLLRELVLNLLDNAIQHMKQPGSVTVSVFRDTGSSGVTNGATSVIPDMCDVQPTGQPRLRIQDTGPGIPSEEWDKVFQRFYRLDDSNPASSGLGLAIVKEIAMSLHAHVALSVPENKSGLQVDVVFLSDEQGGRESAANGGFP